MPKVELNGTVIHYQQLGKGPDIVLVHGLYSNVAVWWQRVALRLAQRFRVTALDLRGHGYSAMPQGGYRAVDLAEDLHALMVHLGAGKAHLVGHSFGGAIVLACAVRHPESVSRATLADAWLPSLQQQPPLPNKGRVTALRRRLAARGMQLQQELPRVGIAFLEELADDPDAVGQVQGICREGAAAPAVPPARAPHTQRCWQRLMTETTAWSEFQSPVALEPAQLSEIRVPVSLIYGRRSRYLATRDALARLLPDCSRTDLDGVGHYFPVLHPDILPDILLGQHRGTRRGRRLKTAVVLGQESVL